MSRTLALPVVTAILFVIVLLGMISTLKATATVSAPAEYRLRFFHTHTGQYLDVVYRRGDEPGPKRYLWH